MEKIMFRGAEAIIVKVDENTLIKNRIKKGYRLKEIDEKLRRLRTKNEFNIMKKAGVYGMNVPKVFGLEKFSFKMQYLKGEIVRDYLENCISKKELFSKIGKQINLMHKKDIVHGDLTTSNMILLDEQVYFIDFSLGGFSTKIEDKAVDLHLIKQALVAKHSKYAKECFDAILSEYADKNVIEKLKSVEKRGRKKSSI